jgi:type VI secretion system secreted protein Hcp
MRSILHPALLALGLAALTSVPALAATNCFLKIDGVVGTSTDQVHKDEIDITGFSWEAKNTGNMPGAGGGNVGKLVADTFRFTMASSKTGPALLHLAATGIRHRQAVLACRRPDGSTSNSTSWTLTDVAVTSFQSAWTGAGGTEPAIEVGLSFGRVLYEYVPQAANGQNSAPVRLDWDLKSTAVTFFSGVPVTPAAAPSAAPPAAPVVAAPPAVIKTKPLALPLPTK